MICDLLNLTSMPCTDPAIYSNKQRQQKNDSMSQSEQLKRVSFFYLFFVLFHLLFFICLYFLSE